MTEQKAREIETRLNLAEEKIEEMDKYLAFILMNIIVVDDKEQEETRH